MKILIADDDVMSRRLLESTLERLGHEVTAASDGPAAVQELLRDEGLKLAILDWMMPGADGLEVCRTVRSRPSPYVYMMLLTAREGRDDMIEALDAGVDDFVTKPFNAMELRARLRSGARVLELQESLLRAQEALRDKAARDNLTGLWNRGMIMEQLRREMKRACHEQRPLAVVIADLDHFKAVNDTHGHGAGDEVLQQAATRMRLAVRDYDFIGRYGGEEFLLVLPGCDAEQARMVAERVREKVAECTVCAGDAAVPIGVSLGVALMETRDEPPALLINRADAALYRAKANGRNRVEF